MTTIRKVLETIKKRPEPIRKQITARWITIDGKLTRVWTTKLE